MVYTVRYEVGAHVLEIKKITYRWSANIDGVAMDRWFMSAADAWTAGVTEALRLEEGKVCLFVGREETGRIA